jgi:hypothetical protein
LALRVSRVLNANTKTPTQETTSFPLRSLFKARKKARKYEYRKFHVPADFRGFSSMPRGFQCDYHAPGKIGEIPQNSACAALLAPVCQAWRSQSIGFCHETSKVTFQAERGANRKSPQAHKNFCPLLPAAIVFVSYGFVLVQVQAPVCRLRFFWLCALAPLLRIKCWFSGV